LVGTIQGSEDFAIFNRSLPCALPFVAFELLEVFVKDGHVEKRLDLFRLMIAVLLIAGLPGVACDRPHLVDVVDLEVTALLNMPGAGFLRAEAPVAACA